jgi:hypothetical protein
MPRPKPLKVDRPTKTEERILKVLLNIDARLLPLEGILSNVRDNARNVLQAGKELYEPLAAAARDVQFLLQDVRQRTRLEATVDGSPIGVTFGAIHTTLQRLESMLAPHLEGHPAGVWVSKDQLLEHLDREITRVREERTTVECDLEEDDEPRHSPKWTQLDGALVALKAVRSYVQAWREDPVPRPLLGDRIEKGDR